MTELRTSDELFRTVRGYRWDDDDSGGGNERVGQQVGFFFPLLPLLPLLPPFLSFLPRHAAVLNGFGSVGRKPQCLTCRTVEERGKRGNGKCR